jgi:hypothetical protein
MATAAATSVGPTGNITAPSGTYVTDWALRNFIENNANFGWTWESGTSTGQPSVVAELRASDGLFQANGSVRSPIFYDSNNTTYYVDPNSTSNLVGLTVANTISGNISGYSKWIDRVANYTWSNSTLPSGYNSGVETSFVAGADGWPNYGVVLSVMGRIPGDPGGNFQLYMGHGTNYGGLGLRVRSINQTSNAWTSWKILLDESNYTSYAMPSSSSATNSVDVRAPIFYDSNSTGYYVDPASTSNISTLNIANALLIVAPNGAYQRADTRTESADSRAHWYGVNSSAGTSNFRHAWYDGAAYFNVTASSGSLSFDRVGGSGYVSTSESFRAPIFYDSNDTGYYANPNSFSQFSSLSCNSDFRAGFVSGAGGSTFSANHYSMGKDIANGGWSHPHYSDLIIGYHTGIRIGGNYSGVRFYANSPTTDANNDGNGDGGEALLMTVGGYVGTANGTDVYVNNNLFAGSSMRAPILYDNNDTGYYIDPNSTSQSALRMRGGALYGPNPTWGTYLLVGGDGRNSYVDNASVASVCSTNGNLHMDAASGSEMYLNYYDGVNVLVGNGATAIVSSLNGGDGSHRAQIFYDYNDTGYYVNPNGTSELSQLSNGTKARAGMNLHHMNRQAYTGDTNYWVGSQGWGTTYTWNSALTILGSCFMDHWGYSTGHPQGSGYVHAQGLQILHYRDGGGADGNTSYGWQMVGAADAGNRWWLRGKWGSTIRSWYEIVTYGINVGGTLYPSISYDSDNTGYYVDANSTSRMGTINADSLYSYGNVTAYSDERLKKDWETLPTNFVEELAKIKSGTYTRIDSGERQVGVGAQSLQAILKEAVSEKEEYLGVHYGNAAMASAVELAKEVVNLKRLSAKQQKQVEDQSSEISELKSMIDILVDKINKLIN